MSLFSVIQNVNVANWLFLTSLLTGLLLGNASTLNDLTPTFGFTAKQIGGLLQGARLRVDIHVN
jgi:hypothetical protein